MALDRLKELRKSRGLLQREVAESLGVDRTTYVRYETGASEPDFSTLQKIADYFEASIDYLLGRADSLKPVQSEDDDDPLPDDVMFAFIDDDEDSTLDMRNLSKEKRDAIREILRLMEAEEK